jgi:hypothetical protein
LSKVEQPQADQFSMLDQPVEVRQHDPETSRAAAVRLNPKSIRLKILRAMSLKGHALATFEIAEELQKGRDIISPHMKPLQHLKLVRKTGGQRLNIRTGCFSELWELTDAGRSLVPRQQLSERDRMLQHRARILSLAAEAQRCHSEIDDLAKLVIPDFHFLDFMVSKFWKCDLSPIGVCVFHVSESTNRPTYCRYCKEPVERK